MKIFTSKTGAKALGIKQDTLKHYAVKYGIGSRPGGPGTPWFFTKGELLAIRNRASLKHKKTWKWEKVEIKEDRKILDLGPLYNKDGTPRS
jgi:hypothetical protein